MAGRRIGGVDPATGKPGGSDPAKKSGAGVIVTFSIVVALAGSGGSVTSTVSAGSDTTASRSSTSSRSESRSGERPALEISTQDLSSVEARLARRGLRANGHLQHDGSNCAEHSYGKVQTFFQQQPCADLYRALFEVRDKKGDLVLIAVSWVRMPDEESARSYHRLVDAPGTGNIIELSRESGNYRTVRYTGLHYRSHRNDTVVTNAQAEPVARGWAGIALASIVNDAIR